MIRAELLLSQALDALKADEIHETDEESKLENLISVLRDLVRATKDQQLSVDVAAAPITLTPTFNVPQSKSPDVIVNIPTNDIKVVVPESAITVNVPRYDFPQPIFNVPEPVINVTYQERENGNVAKEEYDVEITRGNTGMITKLKIKQV